MLQMLASNATYQEIADSVGKSRGYVYDIALRFGARKTERRILERSAERKARLLADLSDLVGTTTKADVLDYLAMLPDNSVSLFVTSPPYNIGRAYGGSTTSDSMRHVYYHGWLMMVISEIARILKPGGTVVMQVGTTHDDLGRTMPIDVMIFHDLVNAGLTYQNRIACVTQAGLTPKRRLAERWEPTPVFSKGPVQTWNPNAARIPQLYPGKRAFKGPNKGKLSGHSLGAWPTDVWKIARIGHNNGEKADHPAQFPIDFAKRAIVLYSAPGDLVCDPFNGSGSTQIAAVRTGRSFTGCDLFYEDERARRLAGEKMDTYSPFTGVTAESMAIWSAEARRHDVDAPAISDEEDGDILLDLFPGEDAE